MKIDVERMVNAEGHLVFTITAKNGKDYDFSEINTSYLQDVDKAIKHMDSLEISDDKIKASIKSHVNTLKELAFIEVTKYLKFAIRHSLQVKFDHICQEIYNWIYDSQDGFVKKWLYEFDPKRSKYYFDNDPPSESDFSECDE